VSPLSNPDAERAILGSVLLDNGRYVEVSVGLMPDDFSLDSHRRIYARMIDLAESSRPIDTITLTDKLEAGKDLAAIGGVGYVASLMDGVPDRPSIESYVRIVVDRSRRRRVMYAATAALEQVNDPGVETSELLHRIQESLLAIEGASTEKTARHISDFLPAVWRELNVQSETNGLLGFGMGIPGLDFFTGGIREKELGDILCFDYVAQMHSPENYSRHFGRLMQAWRHQLPQLICPLKFEEGRLFRRLVPNRRGETPTWEEDIRIQPEERWLSIPEVLLNTDFETMQTPYRQSYFSESATLNTSAGP
jgi:replicative DNA helicase